MGGDHRITAEVPDEAGNRIRPFQALGVNRSCFSEALCLGIKGTNTFGIA